MTNCIKCGIAYVAGSGGLVIEAIIKPEGKAINSCLCNPCRVNFGDDAAAQSWFLTETLKRRKEIAA